MKNLGYANSDQINYHSQDDNLIKKEAMEAINKLKQLGIEVEIKIPNTKNTDIKYLFDKYFVNNHLFIVPTENYSFTEYNTKTLRVEKHIIHNKIINVNYNIDETCYSDMKITYNNYKIIKTIENNLKPIYKYCLPEDISFFNYIYCEYGDYDDGNSKIYALSDEYIYYIYIQK